MSLLYRFAKLPDRHNSHLFTFIVTKSVTRDLYRDVTSKEFAFGYQKWAITFSRTEKIMGCYLVWKNKFPGGKVFVDFSFTLLNREHFSANETFSGKNVKFTHDSPAQGNRRYIPVQDLFSRNFADINGEFQLELQMSSIRTVFETDLRTPNQFISSTPHKTTSRMGISSTGPVKTESTYFNFGGFDWNVAIYPFGKDPSDDRLFVYLNRLTGFDHHCRVRYVITLGEGDRIINSGLLDDISDSNGKSYGWNPRIRLSDVVQRGLIHVHLEILTANTMSEVALAPQVPNVSEGVAVPVTESLAVQLFDKDKQTWNLEADTIGDTLRLRMTFKDVHNVPRNHLRYICWSAYLLRFNNKTGLLDPITCSHAPYSHYYAQSEEDDGIMLETDVVVKEIRDPNSFYLNDKQQVRVQIEWLSSYLLFQSTYHKYDDVTRVHNYQMRKEIAALQSENYSLERQLFSYQKSLAYSHHAARSSSSQGAEEGSYTAPLPFLDRGVSTDTEYA